MLNYSVMANHKNKKYKYKKSRVLSRSLQCWSYGRQIAKEVIERQEFKKYANQWY